MFLRGLSLGGAASILLAGSARGEGTLQTTRLDQAAFMIQQPSSEEWRFTQGPSPNVTSNWIFDTANSLLQHWPNTRFRNGHTLVPGLIPVGTLLYHGTTTREIPTIPEWVATDPEQSYLFCHSPAEGGDTGCWHLTLTVTRPLRVLYFDGSSAAKMWGGPMDSQDVLVWGGVRPERTFDERGRIDDLCKWGKQYEIDGFFRMQSDFEIMICDFSSGLEPVSFLKLHSVDGGIFPYPPPTSSAFRYLEAGNWHNHFPGENRIKLDYSRLISFYDANMFPSLQRLRTETKQERWDQRLEGITPEDMGTLRTELGKVLEGEWGPAASGVDWQALFNVVSSRYSERLEIVRYLVRSISTRSEVEMATGLQRVHRQLTAILRPYILFSLRPPPVAPPTDFAWAMPAFMHCATTHSRPLEKNPRLTGSEMLLLRAVKDVSKEICRVLVGLWAEGKVYGLDEGSGVSTSGGVSLRKLVESWRTKVEDLMAWLDCSYWVRCEPACGYEEFCYMPQWPFFKHMPPGPSPDIRNITTQVVQRDPSNPEDDWDRPVPRCIRRIEPFGVY